MLKDAELVRPTEMGGRVILVGDVHGCMDELRDLLDHVRWQPSNDTVVLLGDLVNKGPKSVEVVRFAQAHGFLAVRGNHDEAALTRREGSFEWADSLSQEDLAWLSNLPYTISIPHLDPPVILVHAGLVPGVPLVEQSWKDMVEMRNVVAAPSAEAHSSSNQEQLIASKSTVEGIGWARAWLGPEHVYFGHDAVRRLQKEPHATGLDTGCCYGGMLTAVILPAGKVEQVPARMAYATIKDKKKGTTSK